MYCPWRGWTMWTGLLHHVLRSIVWEHLALPVVETRHPTSGLPCTKMDSSSHLSPVLYEQPELSCGAGLQRAIRVGQLVAWTTRRMRWSDGGLPWRALAVSGGRVKMTPVENIAALCFWDNIFCLQDSTSGVGKWAERPPPGLL